jgi:hypothetical protein
MIELVFNAPDMATLQADAEQLGFVDPDGNILTAGVTPDGGGWFLNIVGTVYEPIVGPIDPENLPTPVALPGVWGRLRINGGAENVPPFSAAITIYYWSPDVGPVDPETGLPSGGWTTDGKTLAPAYVANIGVIA